MSFKDYFSIQSDDYAKYRPHYPPELFAYLASICAKRELAWDCATGNGQAAIGLTSYFDRVTATDPSTAQIENATRHPKVDYQVAACDRTTIGASTVDLVTVAQALHWFDLPAFYSEVKRVLKPKGMLAVWCYDMVEVTPAIDLLVGEYYHDIVGPYWKPERRLVEEGYRSV